MTSLPTDKVTTFPHIHKRTQVSSFHNRYVFPITIKVPNINVKQTSHRNRTNIRPWFFSSKSFLRVSADSALSIENGEYPCLSSLRLSPTLSLSELTTRDRAICDPIATLDFIIVSIRSTCLLISGGNTSLAGFYSFHSPLLTTPLRAADIVETLNRRRASFASSTVASGANRIFARLSAIRTTASSCRTEIGTGGLEPSIALCFRISSRMAM